MANIAPKFNRLKDAPWFTNGVEEVIVGGAGGISSWLCLFLTRAGFTVHVYDFDTFEEHNMGGQFCRATDVGKPKVDALSQSIKEYCAEQHIFTYNEKYTAQSMTHKYVFAGFDNIEARKVMFSKWRKEHGSDPTAIYIDGRLQPEALEIFCIRGGTTPENIVEFETYEREHLFDDSEVDEAPCSFKQTTHAAAMIASHMVGFFTNHISNVANPEAGRMYPFQWNYYLPIDMVN